MTKETKSWQTLSVHRRGVGDQRWSGLLPLFRPRASKSGPAGDARVVPQADQSLLWKPKQAKGTELSDSIFRVGTSGSSRFLQQLISPHLIELRDTRWKVRVWGRRPDWRVCSPPRFCYQPVSWAPTSCLPLRRSFEWYLTTCQFAISSLVSGWWQIGCALLRQFHVAFSTLLAACVRLLPGRAAVKRVSASDGRVFSHRDSKQCRLEKKADFILAFLRAASCFFPGAVFPYLSPRHLPYLNFLPDSDIFIFFLSGLNALLMFALQ